MTFMVFIGAIYTALLMATVAFIALRGRQDERVVLAALAVGTVSTFVIYQYWGSNFIALQLPMLINEAAVLAILLAVAFRSTHFWPLPVAAFQLAAFLALLTPYFGKNIVSYGLGVAQGVWAYPQLIILAIAAARRPRRETPESSLPN